MKDYFKMDKEYYSRSGVYIYTPATWISSNAPSILLGLMILSLMASIVWYSAPQYADVSLGIIMVSQIGSMISLVVSKVKSKKEVKNESTWF